MSRPAAQARFWPALSACWLRPRRALLSRQAYPSRAIQLIVPFAAGGGVDVVTRVVAEAAGDIIKQRFVIENRGGAGTVLGSQAVAKAEADGYTLLAAPTTMVINPSLRTNLPFDWKSDLVPVAMIAKLPFVVSAGLGLPVKTMKELEALRQDARHADHLRFGRRQHGGASGGRVLRADLGHEDAACRLSRRSAGSDRYDQRQYRRHVLDAGRRLIPGQGRHLAGACRHHGQAHEPAARRADRGRAGLWRLRPLRLGRAGRAEGHAAGCRRGAELRSERSAGQA